MDTEVVPVGLPYCELPGDEDPTGPWDLDGDASLESLLGSLPDASEPVFWAIPGVTGLSAVEPGDVPVSPAVARLLTAIAAVQAQDPSQLPGRRALTDARVLLEAGHALRLANLTRLADIEARRLHELDSAPSVSVWAARQDLDLPRGDVTLARRIGKVALVRDALQAGRISLGTARVLQAAVTSASRFLDRPDHLIDGLPQDDVLQAIIVDGIRQLSLQALGGLPDLTGPDGHLRHDPRVTDLVDELQTIADGDQTGQARLQSGLLVLARYVAPTNLPGAVGLLLDALLPQQLRDRADRAHRNRGVTLTRNPDGSGWHLRGDLNLLTGERLFVLLQAEATRDPRNPLDTDAARSLYGRGLDPHDPAHHAFSSRPDRAAWPPEGPDRPDATAPPEATECNVVVGPDVGLGLDGPQDVSTLAARMPDCAVPRSRRHRLHDAFSTLLRRALDHGLAGTSGKTPSHLQITVSLDGLHGVPGTLPATTSSGSALPADVVRQTLCNSRITRLLMSLGGKQIQHSHTGRTATAAERAAKAVETGTVCQAAGCARGPDLLTTTEVHHATPWTQTHLTSHSDSVWLCTTSHDQLHHGATLQLTDGRWLGPHGWTSPPIHPPTWPETPPF